LREVEGVVSRPMFGGYGLYRHDVFFGIIYKNCLYFRTGPASVGEYLRLGSRPFTPTVGRKKGGSRKVSMNTYHEVPAEVMDDAHELAEWAETAIQEKIKSEK